MVSVEYSHRYHYRRFAEQLFPMFTVEIRNPSDPNLAIEQDAFLDSGASRSIFRGEVPAMLGLNLLDGDRWSFETNTGETIDARVHPVQLVLPATEDEPAPTPMNLNLAFALGDVRRNLLGRDFFDLAQIGFREHRLEFVLLPVP